MVKEIIRVAPLGAPSVSSVESWLKQDASLPHDTRVTRCEVPRGERAFGGQLTPADWLEVVVPTVTQLPAFLMSLHQLARKKHRSIIVKIGERTIEISGDEKEVKELIAQLLRGTDRKQQQKKHHPTRQPRRRTTSH